MIESKPKAGWWKGATLYQIYPRSFQDINGDGVGDLLGITARLGYIAELGVDGIWISPFFPSPMDDFGYDVSDYCGVDSLFGTLDDFDALIARAHDLGLKIIIDMVLSHTSNRHSWFIESSQSFHNDKADWYVWADPLPDGNPPNNWLSIFGGSAWQWHAKRQQYYLHNFLTSQPDLNIHHVPVQDALLAACQFWLERGVDGFRLDAINFIAHDPLLRSNPARDPALLDGASARKSNPYAFQSHIYDKSRPEALTFLHRLKQVAKQYGDILLLGEVGDDNEIDRLAEYTGEKGPLDTGYCFRFFQDFVHRPLIESTLDALFERPENPWPSWAFSNHDFKRVATRWSQQWDGTGVDLAARAYFALLIALPGTIFVYQGEELGLPQADLAFEDLRDPYDITFYPDHVGRDGCRTPFPWNSNQENAGFSTSIPWLPITASHVNRALNKQQDNKDSPYHAIKALITWRKSEDILRHGKYRINPNTPKHVVMIERWIDNDQSIVIAVNLSPTETGIEIPIMKVSPLTYGSKINQENLCILEPWGILIGFTKAS